MTSSRDVSFLLFYILRYALIAIGIDEEAGLERHEVNLVRFEVEKVEMLGRAACFYISEHSNNFIVRAAAYH